MFRLISIIAFIVTLVGIALCCVACPCKGCGWRPSQVLRRLVRLFTLLLVEQRLSPLGVIRKLIYLLALLCFVVLAVTSFFPVLVQGKPIHGYWLMLHATFAPVFAVCLAVLAVISARHFRFSRGDWPWLQRIIERVTLTKNSSEEDVSDGLGIAQKIAFWLIVALSLPLILSIISSMFPLLGTHWQEFVLNVHRYTALAFAVVVIIHTYLMIRVKMKE